MQRRTLCALGVRMCRKVQPKFLNLHFFRRYVDGVAMLLSVFRSLGDLNDCHCGIRSLAIDKSCDLLTLLKVCIKYFQNAENNGNNLRSDKVDLRFHSAYYSSLFDSTCTGSILFDKKLSEFIHPYSGNAIIVSP
jgi:hypothetical protein